MLDSQITLEAGEQPCIESSGATLTSTLPAQWPRLSLSSSDGDNVAVAQDVIRQTEKAFPPERIGISFNGGKDSVVVVELIASTLGLSWLQKCCFFVLSAKCAEFLEMEAFRRKYIQTRLPGVLLHEVDASNGLKAGLWTVKKQFGIEAVFMGTRKDDPSGKFHASHWEPTTEGWPAMLRVCPILGWNYKDVWTYTLAEQLQFCELYQRGYTSLGDPRVTSPNDNLARGNGDYAPAWALTHPGLERIGRQ